MATAKQKQAARKNIGRAQQAWQRKSSRARSLAQPKGRARAKPGTTGGGDFYHIEVRPKSEFKTFRTQDVGKKGNIERVAGRRRNGSWDTQKWLVAKKLAHVHGGRLVADSPAAKKVLNTLGSSPRHLGADRFQARPRPNVPEKLKPTAAQKRARRQNIKKAQAARHNVK